MIIEVARMRIRAAQKLTSQATKHNPEVCSLFIKLA
jgi:hypothetical protein